MAICGAGCFGNRKAGGKLSMNHKGHKGHEGDKDMRSLQGLLVVTAILSCGLILSGQGPAAGRYTAAQATAGRATYQAQCAACHLPDLRGSGDAAPLAGTEFMDAWGRRTATELLSFMQLTMPPTRPGGLRQEEYVNVAAFLLKSNGWPPGHA